MFALFFFYDIFLLVPMCVLLYFTFARLSRKEIIAVALSLCNYYLYFIVTEATISIAMII